MVNKSKIFSDLSKMALDAMGSLSELRKEVEKIASSRVNKIINKMNLVKRDEFEVLKKLVQKLLIENENLRKNSKLTRKSKKTTKKKKIVNKKYKR